MENENGKLYDLPSGAKLYVSVAEWGKVKTLHDALARAAIGGGISPMEVAVVMKTVLAKTLTTAAGEGAVGEDDRLTTLAVLARKLLEMGSSKELEDAIFACAEAAFYRPDGTDKLSLQFKASALGRGVFDNLACRDMSRGDYYDICEAICEVNLHPFGLALLSRFSAHVGKSGATQKSNTVTA